jgi:hypothetical protein
MDDEPDVFLPPETWEAKQTSEIITELGGDYETPPPAFNKKEFVRAACRAGIETGTDNGEMLNKYKDRILNRIEFAWSDRTEQFEPVDGSDVEAEPNLDTDKASDVGEDDAAVDVDTESVTDRMDEPEGATQVRADGGGDSDDTTQQERMDAVTRVIDALAAQSGHDSVEIETVVEAARHEEGVPKEQTRHVLSQLERGEVYKLSDGCIRHVGGE